MSLQKGICYDGFPPPYEPSTANRTCIFFASDAAYDAMAPLWGSTYRSSTGSSCGENGPACRNDIRTMYDMGVEVVRLYDWDPRNRHLDFLDACHHFGLSVLVPVSSFFLRQVGGFPERDKLIPGLIRSFANAEGTDYHPAVAGVIFGNELDGYGVEECVVFTQSWVRHEKERFPHFRRVPIGHPVQFDPFGAKYPCFGFWDRLLPPLRQDHALVPRLFLAPQTYNEAAYLFDNAEASGHGWLDLAWRTYKTPVWFTEIGQSRVRPGFGEIVRAQLQGVREYGGRHPDRLIGACFFQFVDKAWRPRGDSEGEYGAFAHSERILCTISYTAKDFTHWEAGPCNDTLKVDALAPTALFDAVTSVYAKS